MSLERKMRQAKKAIKKRDAKLAKEGTSAGAEQAKRNAEIERRTAAASLSKAQQEAAKAPSIKSVGEDSLKHGDAPEEVANDNGYGTHIEHPRVACTECPAKFHTRSRLAEHTDFYHGDPEKLFGN